MLYEASGYYKGSGTFKESYHLFWLEAGAGREGRNHQVHWKLSEDPSHVVSQMLKKAI